MPRLNCIVPWTIIKLVMLGRICSIEIRASDFPQTLADKTKSRSQRGSAAARVRRAKTGILKIPIATIAFTADAPKTAVIRIAITKEGNANIRSFPRIIISSIKHPRRAAEKSPKGTPIVTPIPTASNATAIDVRAPIMIIEKISRPK